VILVHAGKEGEAAADIAAKRCARLGPVAAGSVRFAPVGPEKVAGY
jgi:hypothetical protein